MQSTNSIIFQETVYHKTSVLKFQLGTFLDKTKFKIEVAPCKDPNAQTRNYDYDNSVSMVFEMFELFRIKKIFENLLSGKGTQFVIEHFFDKGGSKQKSSTFFKRLEKSKQPTLGDKDPFAYPAIITMSVSTDNKSHSFGFTDEEAYSFVQLIPIWAQEMILEKARVKKILISNSKGSDGGQKSTSSYSRTNLPEDNVTTPPATNIDPSSDFSGVEDIPF